MPKMQKGDYSGSKFFSIEKKEVKRESFVRIKNLSSLVKAASTFAGELSS